MGEQKKNSKDAAQEMQAQMPFRNIAIIGLGLIGASLAAAVKKAYPEVNILGVDSDSRTCVVAKERKWVDEAVRPDDSGSDALRKYISDSAELVVIATPVAAVDGYFELLDSLDYTGLLTDTVSTKSHMLDAAETVLRHPECYIPGHPMAGSEQDGIDGARSDLFEGANWILCPDDRTSPESFQLMHEFVTALQARVVAIPREDHDKAIAIVSHVPHMVASSLVRLAVNHVDDNKQLMRLAAGGFKDTTRVAAGSPKLWCGIAFDNKDALADGLNEMEDIIKGFRAALESDDREAFTSMLATSADARRALPAAWIPSSEKLLEVRIPMVNRKGVVAEVANIASSVGCNIQSIDIDHISEGNAVLSLILTDEGDIGQLSYQLISEGYSVSFNPIQPKERSNGE